MDSRVPVDAPGDSRSDAPSLDSGRDTRSDGAPVDTSVRVDTSVPDGGVLCPTGPDGDTIAYYDFTDTSLGLLTDTAGLHHGAVVGGVALVTAGPTGCGNAIAFARSPLTFGAVPNSPDFSLSSGSIDFFLRYDAPLPRPMPTREPATVGVLSRDANGVTPGHMTIWIAPDGSVVLRVQRSSGNIIRCTEPVTTGTWHHVGVNFGSPVEVYLDGAVSTRTDVLRLNLGPMTPFDFDCGLTGSGGIDGNTNPFTVGAQDGLSPEGLAAPSQPFANGAIDQLRISRERRSF